MATLVPNPIDENLSPRLVSVLSAHWPKSAHVESINMRGATDEAIWSFARDHGNAPTGATDALLKISARAATAMAPITH